MKFLIDVEIFPPFEGFPREGIAFLRRLRKNNNREWFSKHESEYESFVKFPMQCLIASMRLLLAQLAPEIFVNPKRSMFRVYRDTRFSKDKTPYKTHVAAVFHLKGHWQESAGYYLHIEPGRIYVGGGIYMPNGTQLKLIRHAITEYADEFVSIVESKSFLKRFEVLEGDKLQRAPLGYQQNHPMIKYLNYKSFYAGIEWKETECFSPRFLSKIITVYKELLPFIRFLNRALGKV